MKKKFHIVGIGGIGTSSLARHLLAEGHRVSGSDLLPPEELSEKGASLFKGHDKQNVPSDTDELIYSTAVDMSNPEIERAKELGIRIRSYPQALGEITKKYYTITVSGTHGKSTTTSMLALIMVRAGLDPTVIVGTKLREFDGANYRKGDSRYLLIEADEHEKALLNYTPRLAIINNIEEDHLDCYSGISEIIDTFYRYTRVNLEDGILVINEDDDNCVSLLERGGLRAKIDKYGMSSEEAREIKLSVPGKHNIYNALAALRAACLLEVEKDIAFSALKEFKGSWRRFEESDISLLDGRSIRVINDYAHHPTAVRATLEAACEKYPQKRIVALFQPHQYERTHRLFSSFVEKLSSLPVDELLITDIYTVTGRESSEIKEKVSAEQLCQEIKGATHIGNLNDARNHLLGVLREGDILVIMGAGDVYGLIDRISREE